MEGLSLWSQDSFLSLGSRGSFMSVGSVGCALSIGSVGSVASAFSIGSAASLGSVLSAGSTASLLSAGADGAILGQAEHRRGAAALTSALLVAIATAFLLRALGAGREPTAALRTPARRGTRRSGPASHRSRRRSA